MRPCISGARRHLLTRCSYTTALSTLLPLLPNLLLTPALPVRQAQLHVTYTSKELNTRPVKYCFTIPAGWSEEAKHKMRL